MIIWATLILLLSLALVVGSFAGADASFQTVISYSILLVALAILRRVWLKTKARQLESFNERIEELKTENEQLKSKLGSKGK
jgi:hypothetical protein